MNLNPTAAQSESPIIQRTDGAQAQGVAAEFPRPKSWSYMHRAKWAGSLPVPAAVQRTAICIADHINERTGRWDLSSAQMADETNQCERTIRSHIKMIRPYIHVEDRPGPKVAIHLSGAADGNGRTPASVDGDPGKRCRRTL